MYGIDPSKIIFQPVTVTFLEMHESKVFPQLQRETRFEILAKPVSVEDYRN